MGSKKDAKYEDEIVNISVQTAIDETVKLLTGLTGAEKQGYESFIDFLTRAVAETARAGFSEGARLMRDEAVRDIAEASSIAVDRAIDVGPKDYIRRVLQAKYDEGYEDGGIEAHDKCPTEEFQAALLDRSGIGDGDNESIQDYVKRSCRAIYYQGVDQGYAKALGEVNSYIDSKLGQDPQNAPQAGVKRIINLGRV